jgi:archaellum biogenesis ATPase FlaH
MAAVSKQFHAVIDDNLFLREEAQLYAPGSERAILALIVKCPQLIVEVSRLIPVEWFMGELNIRMYKILLFVYGYCTTNGWPLAFDSVTVLNVARQMGPQYEASFCRNMDGLDKWNGLVNFANYVALDALPQHLATLREASARVEMFRMLKQLRVPCATGTGDIDGLVGELICGSERIRDSHSVRQKVVMSESAKKALSDESYSRRLFCPKYEKFSSVINGFRPGSVMILAGRSKAGKSKLVTRMSLGFASSKVWVKYLDSEMSDGEVAVRQLSMLTGLGEEGLRKPENATSVQQGMDNLAHLSAWIDYENISDMSTDQIMTSIHDFRRRIGPDAKGVVIYDWMQNTDKTGRIPEHIALGDLTTQIKNTATRTNLPVIVLTQQNRAALSATHSEQSGAGELYVSGSDRVVHKSTTVCHIRGVNQDLAAAILARFGSKKFTHILSVDISRFSKSRVSIPILAQEETNRMEEVADDETMQFLDEYNKSQSKARRDKVRETQAARPSLAPVVAIAR